MLQIGKPSYKMKAAVKKREKHERKKKPHQNDKNKLYRSPSVKSFHPVNRTPPFCFEKNGHGWMKHGLSLNGWAHLMKIYVLFGKSQGKLENVKSRISKI